MLNKDINARFEDWLLNPSEALDFEAKQWINMDDVECQGLVAKALIALENHGGGFLLFGYKEDEHKKLVPDLARPTSLMPYLTDSLNAIVKKRAEPSFHVEVTLQKRPGTGEEYPLVRVHGGSKVPVRSDSATTGGSLKQNVYYIRASGPESRGPVNGAEWDNLLRRAVLSQREEIVSVLRAFLPATGGTALVQAPLENEELKKFVNQAFTRWSKLNDSIPTDHPSRIKRGHFSFAARVVGQRRGIPAAKVLDAIQRARKYTGWPVFVTLHQEASKPKMVDDCIEAWLVDLKFPDVGYADFWRIHPEGFFYSLCGYQEDSESPDKQLGTPGKLFEATLPIWRLGEFLLRVSDVSATMFENGFEIIVECKWTGLAGRTLFVDKGRRSLGRGKAAQDTVQTSGRFPGTVRDVLPEAVNALTKKLYERFDFTEIPDFVFVEELNEMTKNKF